VSLTFRYPVGVEFIFTWSTVPVAAVELGVVVLPGAELGAEFIVELDVVGAVPPASGNG
jgi:hypothetical protein